MDERVKQPTISPMLRDRALRTFEDGLRAVPRERVDVERMRWHCKMTDPQGHVTIVAEYRLHADGSFAQLWVLPDAQWPVPPEG
jgi:hypothetical protein